jgi:NAD(P)-dependent dehydrogenase (short-subunit alcohol dehydrogenase family)
MPRQQPTPPFPPQHHPKPGLESDLSPQPRFKAPDYRPASKLDGKVALITGGDSGIGRAVAAMFAREGADIAINHLPEEVSDAEDTRDEIERAGRAALLLPGDLADPAVCSRIVGDTIRHFGRLDILVNNVGGSAAGGPVEMSEEVWDAQVDFNLKSVFLGCKYALPVMERQGSGAIVNIASSSGLRWTGSAQVAYAATKAGVIQLSRVVAVQYAARGIRVNTVVPGQLHTPMVEARLAGQRAGGDVEKILKERLNRIPLRFAGDGRDTANAALFLASDEARFITGAEIVVDGGMTIRCD